MKHILYVFLTAIFIALPGLIFLISYEEIVWLKWEWVMHPFLLLINVKNIKFAEKI